MPLELDVKIIKWLKQLGLIQTEVPSGSVGEISYNDQIYFQNGYLIGQLLRHILRSKGFRSEALMRIRKIAHISSNENWQIIKEIMQDIHFEEEIDTHAMTLHQIRSIVEFIHHQFSAKLTNIPQKKQKKAYIDPGTFSTVKPLEQSYNLLQFFILATSKVFGIPLQECLGLLIDNCRYFKKIVVQGTNNKGFDSIIEFYKLVAQNMPLINRLIGEESDSQASFMNTLSLGVFSESNEVCEIVCIVIDNLQSNNWIDSQGCNVLLKSSNDKVIDLLLRKINPNFGILFNEQLSTKFTNKFNELTNYSKLLKYLFKSIYSREIFELLPLSYYLKAAFEIFEPDEVKKQQKKVKLAAKTLMKVIVSNFWSKIHYEQKNRICFSFSPQFCESQQQRLSTLCILFEIISELSLREAQFVQKYYRIINQFYSKGTVDTRAFILNNFIFLYKYHAEAFPMGFFLQTYQIVTPVQTSDYQLICLLSNNKTLMPEEAIMLLKICTIYYYQQLQAACFLHPITNILNNYTPIEWSNQLAQEILTKWPTLPIPPFQMVPPNTNKIKFRSIGLKKKQMLQFTELNRYKSILKLLVTVKNREFLMMFGRLITSTISKVQKSKIREMQNTKVFLNALLAKVDSKKFQLKQQKVKQSIRSKSQALRPSQQDELETDPFLQQYDRNDFELNTPINILKSQQNEFMQQPTTNQFQVNPLLPFTDDVIFDPTQKRYSEDSLFENYELVYIKNAASKYEGLLKYVAQRYEHSANLEHFLNNLNIYSYFESEVNALKRCEDRLRLSQDKPQTVSFKLILEMAFMLFQFKKSRRITVKCVESFLELLSQKNHYPNSQQTQIGNPFAINAKIDFKYQITNKNIQCNSSAQKYIICFQVVSDLLKKAIGINAVQPISCIISQIVPSNNNSPQKSTTKNMQKSRISEMELKEYEQLQKLIEKEQKMPKIQSNNSTPLRLYKEKSTPSKQVRQVKPKVSEKWAQVQKKVIMRRRQLQGNKTINES